MSAGRVVHLRVWAARAQQLLGWAGLVGVVLLVAASAWLAVAWHAHRMPLPDENLSALPVPTASAQARPVVTALELPRRSEVSLLLTQIQQAVVSQGLAWAAADYKLLPATDTAPAVLEVRCSLKGSYPKLRAAVAQLLRSVPGLTVRDLSMGRANIDLAEVDAKLTLGVFLQDESPLVVEGIGPAGKP